MGFVKNTTFFYSISLSDMGVAGAQMVKNLPAVQETQIGSLGWEHNLEKGTANHFSFLAWGISWTEKSGGL